MSKPDIFKYFVYVLESPSALDIYQQRSEGEIIRQAVNLNLIPCTVVTAINTIAFEAALKLGLTQAMKDNPGMFPILHISAHGYSEGIQLSNGEVLNWKKLRDMLVPINQALSGGLLVCLSCCEGYSGIRMAIQPDHIDDPFFAIIANSGKPLWGDTAVGYSTFYHLVAKGSYLRDAVEAMKIASGNNTFWIETAVDTRQGYLEYLKEINVEQAQEKLRALTSSEQPQHLRDLQKINEKN